MLNSNPLKLAVPQLPAWDLLYRWRWWVALGCAVLGFLLEKFEHQLEMNLDALEVLAYSLILPLAMWLIMTLLARALAERTRALTTQIQHQQVLKQLDQHYSWDELTRWVVRLPGTLLPVRQARLYTYDHQAAQFQLAADLNGNLFAQMHDLDQAPCQTCPLTQHPHSHSGQKEYCQPLVYDKLLVGLLRLRFLPNQAIDHEQLQFLNTIAPKIALALAMSIVQPQRLTQAQTEARHDERRQLAYELHDSLAQNLGYLHLSLDRLASESSSIPTTTAQQELAALREIAADAYLQVRDQLAWLHSQQSADLIQSLRYYTQLIQRRSRIRISLVSQGEPVGLPAGTPTQVLGLVRESLNNVQRHACAYEAQVVLYWSADLLVLTVVDDGLGFNPTESLSDDHHGLKMLRERVSRLNGRLNIHSAPNLGTRLIFYIPLDQSAREAAGLRQI